MIVQPKDGHILYQKGVGWSYTPVETDTPELIEQIPITELSKKKVWYARDGYRFCEVVYFENGMNMDMDEFTKVFISEERPMTDFLEIPLMGGV